MGELYTSSGVLTREACHLCAVKIGIQSVFAIIIIKLLLFFPNKSYCLRHTA